MTIKTRRDRAKKGAYPLLKCAVALALAVALMAGFVPVYAVAAGNGFSDDNLFSIVPDGDPSEFGYQETKLVDADGNPVEEEILPESEASRDRVNGVIPSSYDSRTITNTYGSSVVTGVKDQRGTGNCWAFATLSSMESTSLMQNFGAFFDFSEMHLAYFGNNSSTSNTADPMYGDGETTSTPYDDGGNYYISGAALARGAGAVDEYYEPNMKGNTNYRDKTFVESERYEADMLLDNMYVIYDYSGESYQKAAIPASDRNNIKQAIMTYGGAQMSYYASGYPSDYTGNNGTYCYCTSQYTSTNHAVYVVGWDDNFSESNFRAGGSDVTKTIPKSNGAWLVKNSWGSDWCDGGYFWLSYEDVSMDNVVVFKSCEADTVDNIYQYDGSWDGISLYRETEYNVAGIQGANVFTADSSETLTKVGFFCLNTDVSVKVDIYLLGSGEKVTSAAKASTTNTSVTSAGYKTIELATPVALTAGQRFSVVITLTSNTQELFMTVEYGGYSSASAGQSFMNSTYKESGVSSSTWYDTSANGRNVLIKAYTTENNGGDTAALRTLYNTVALNGNYFCAAYDEALFAKTVLENESASKIEITTAYNRLNAAYENVRDNPSKFVFIGNKAEFASFAASVNSGTSYYGKTIVLTADVDFTGENYTTIGSSGSSFSGTFQGAGHTLSNITYSRSGYSGVFGSTNIATVQNLHVSDSDFLGSYTGGIASYVRDTDIVNCSYEGRLGMYNGAGGIAYSISNNTKIQNCYADAEFYRYAAGTTTSGVAAYTTGAKELYNNYYLDSSETDSLSGTSYFTAADISSGSLKDRLNSCQSVDQYTQSSSEGSVPVLIPVLKADFYSDETTYYASQYAFPGDEVTMAELDSDINAFLGWYTQLTDGEEASSITGNAVFYARWGEPVPPGEHMIPYYMDGDREVFLCMAAYIDGEWKYMAPDGAEVLYKRNTKSFNDISGHWGTSQIQFATEREIFSGTGANTFAPDDNMTRAMFATVMSKLYATAFGSLDTSNSIPFTDVPAGAWYATPVAWASSSRVISGVGNNRFAPDNNVTREEMAVMLYNLANFMGMDTSAAGAELRYTDASSISPWAANAALWCQESGIISGRGGGSFVPKGTATRAEVAAVLNNFINYSLRTAR